MVPNPKSSASSQSVVTDALKGGIHLPQDANFHHQHCDTGYSEHITMKLRECATWRGVMAAQCSHRDTKFKTHLHFKIIFQKL